MTTANKDNAISIIDNANKQVAKDLLHVRAIVNDLEDNEFGLNEVFARGNLRDVQGLLKIYRHGDFDIDDIKRMREYYFIGLLWYTPNSEDEIKEAKVYLKEHTKRRFTNDDMEAVREVQDVDFALNVLWNTQGAEAIINRVFADDEQTADKLKGWVSNLAA